MEEPVESRPRRSLLLNGPDLRGLDSIDNCRMRLLSLRTRIETNWPTAGGRFFNRSQGLGPESHAVIADLLVALPTPLPLVPGGQPEAIICVTDTDMLAIAGRAVDACFALMDGATLETPYPRDVTLFESRRPDALEPIVISKPTVGLLVATIIGTLEAISESITEPAPAASKAKAQAAKVRQKKAAAPVPEKARGKAGVDVRLARPQRGRVVPRI